MNPHAQRFCALSKYAPLVFFFFAPSAGATGYYNFGMNWKGAINPYQLAGVLTLQIGFTSGLGISSSNTDGAHGGLSSPEYIAIDGSGNIYVADSTNKRIVKYDSSGVFQSSIATIGSPMSISFDTSGNMYVTDAQGDGDVSKYDPSGNLIGWIGNIATSPTGGNAGCAGATPGTFTPGWCTGGTSTYGMGDGMINGATHVAFDTSGNLYVSDWGNARINKYSSTGAFLGWIGGVLSTPTGGATGCDSAVSGSFTPGWCTGGTSQGGVGDGMLSQPRDVALDSSGNIYVSDGNGGRISKYSPSGAFLGWIGAVGSSPSGGDPGCSGKSAGTFTPGWCTGGASAIGSGDGMLNGQRGIVMAPSGGTFYVADYVNNRVSKYSLAGAFLGWIGAINTSPSSGATGCNGAAAGTLTPGWCKGGTAALGNGDGMLNGPSSVALDSAGNVYVTDRTNSRVNKYDSSGAFLGAMQSVAAIPTGWQRGQASARGAGDGMLYRPQGVAQDSSKNLYVTDSSNHRINKYSADGTFVGWIGNIATSPTGGATGCNGASAGTFTPGWCKGGTSASGTGDGMLNNPFGITVDSSGNIYVVDSGNHRVSKYSSAGAFQGWIGKVASTPSGGATGCSATAAGLITPGWCKGGTSTSGTGDGMLNSPSGITLDTAGNIYVADTSNHRFNKYDTNGVFQGWIGKVASAPSGGATGCTSASVGNGAPGWCTGGSSTSGSGDGMFKSPQTLAFDSAGNFYVGDTLNGRISKYNSSGAFQGWIGEVDVKPTGGATGCSTATRFSLTPGWCTGGAAAIDEQNGGMERPSAMVIDGNGNIFVVDSLAYRIGKYHVSGAYLGWMGLIGSSPTGGAAGCKGAAVGTFTPGWCVGGSASVADASTMGFIWGTGISLDASGNLHVADYTGNRVMRISVQGK